MSELDQAGHGREPDPDAVEFQTWWEHDSGWGGVPLAEYHLARAAWSAGQAQLRARVAELEAKVAELEGEGNFTAAEALQEWFNGANIQGVAQMEGVEMRELVEAFQPIVQEAKE